MRCLVRAGLAAALVALVFSPALAADKAFKQSGLDEAAIKLEAQIKSDAGRSASLPRRCGAMPMPPSRRTISAPACWCSASSSPLRRTMRRAGCGCRAPSCRSSRATTAKKRCCSIAPRPRPTSPTSAHATATSKRTACQCSARRLPTGSNGAARSIPCACRSNCGKPPTFAANTKSCGPSTVSACSTIRSIPIRFLRAPVSSFPRNCPAGAPTSRPLSPLRAWNGRRSSANEKQLCVEGLKHGERYSVTLRAGLPSVVKETLAKSAEFTIFVRDRKPFVRFSGKAYVLPRTGQRGIPVLSVNTQAVALSIYRDRRPQSRRHASRLRLSAQSEPLPGGATGNERGAKVWSGELAVELKLNTEVTTAFPLDQAVKDLGPGVYAMTAEPRMRSPTNTASRRRNGSSFPISG